MPAPVRQPEAGALSSAIQRAWNWNTEHDCWEEDQLGYTYDPTTEQWTWNGDEQQVPNPVERTQQRHRAQEDLFETMDSDALRDFIPEWTPNGVTLIGSDNGLGDSDDEDFAESHMGEGPESIQIKDGQYAGTLGANNCVVLLVRGRSSAGAQAVGSSHLDADDMASIDTCLAAIKDLLDNLRTTLAGDLESHEAYVLGGADLDQDAEDDEQAADQLAMYARLTVAIDESELHVVSMMLPASVDKGYIDAFIDAGSVQVELIERNEEEGVDVEQDDEEHAEEI